METLHHEPAPATDDGAYLDELHDRERAAAVLRCRLFDGATDVVAVGIAHALVASWPNVAVARFIEAIDGRA